MFTMWKAMNMYRRMQLLGFFVLSILPFQLLTEDSEFNFTLFSSELGEPIRPGHINNGLLSITDPLWINGTIPFVISNESRSGYSDDQLSLMNSMALISNLTNGCIRFVNRTDEKPYIMFIYRRFCAEEYHFEENGIYKMKYGVTCEGHNKGDLVRILGNYDELERPDRGVYLDVNFDNLKKPYGQRSEKSSGRAMVEVLRTPFDMNSVTLNKYLHEHPWLKPDDKTIRPKSELEKLGGSFYSPLDIARLVMRHQCASQETVYRALRKAGYQFPVRPNGLPPGDWENYNNVNNRPANISRFFESALKSGTQVSKPVGGAFNWPDGIIYYEFFDATKDLVTEDWNDNGVAETYLQAAMEMIQNATGGCVKFVQHSNQLDYISCSMVNDAGRAREWVMCASMRGRRTTKRYNHFCPQQKRWNDYATCKLVFARLLLIILGFEDYESNRHDRDAYVWINWNNWAKGFADSPRLERRNYSIPYNDVLFPYDYESVTHFHWNQESQDPDEPTVIPKNKGMILGRDDGLSAVDVARLLYGYQCIPTSTIIDIMKRENIKLKIYDDLAISSFSKELGQRRKRGIANGNLTWLDGIVHYNISPFFNEYETGILKAAMEEISEATSSCISFESHPIEFESPVLKISPDDRKGVCLCTPPTQIHVSTECLKDSGKILGLLLCVLGFTDEILRPDREEHLNISWNKFYDAEKDELAVNTFSPTFNLPFDVETVNMLTSRKHPTRIQPLTAVSVNGTPFLWTPRGHLSKLDIARLNLGYKCVEQQTVSAALKITHYGEDPEYSKIVTMVVAVCGGLIFFTVTVLGCRRFRTRRGRMVTPFLPLTRRISLIRLLDNCDQDLTRLIVARENIFEGGCFLGKGYFSVVSKGCAVNLWGTEGETVVAIKRVQKSNVSELNIELREIEFMIRMGRHLNIVNLLAFVCDHEVLMLLEYCSSGSIRSYVKSHGERFFYNHVNENGELLGHDPEREYMLKNEALQYPLPKPPNSSEPFDELMMSTNDLINFSYQIARGMEYLTSRGVVHCDLAARNVLIGSGRIAKVSDFGLARHLSTNLSTPIKTASMAVPVKWMPPESLEQNIFNEATDVWSFGVTIWEIFSLGMVPYQEVENSRSATSLVPYLLEGNRLELPIGSPKFVYDVMLCCWAADSGSRPSFESLRRTFQSFVSTEYYLDLDASYDEYNATLGISVVLVDSSVCDLRIQSSISD